MICSRWRPALKGFFRRETKNNRILRKSGLITEAMITLRAISSLYILITSLYMVTTFSYGVEPSSSATPNPSMKIVERLISDLNKKNIPIDLKQLLLQAKDGNAKALNEIGGWYERWTTCAPDPVAALKWYKVSANQGNPCGQYHVGHIYYKAGNYSEAFKWFEKAACQGEGRSEYFLFRMYQNAKGVPRDPKMADEWINKPGAICIYLCDVQREEWAEFEERGPENLGEVVVWGMRVDEIDSTGFWATLACLDLGCEAPLRVDRCDDCLSWSKMANIKVNDYIVIKGTSTGGREKPFTDGTYPVVLKAIEVLEDSNDIKNNHYEFSDVQSDVQCEEPIQ
jgi:hypothetical protein